MAGRRMPPDDELAAGSDGVGEPHVFCPECWEREFGEVDARPLRSEHQGSAPQPGLVLKPPLKSASKNAVTTTERVSSLAFIAIPPLV